MTAAFAPGDLHDLLGDLVIGNIMLFATFPALDYGYAAYFVTVTVDVGSGSDIIGLRLTGNPTGYANKLPPDRVVDYFHGSS